MRYLAWSSGLKGQRVALTGTLLKKTKILLGNLRTLSSILTKFSEFRTEGIFFNFLFYCSFIKYASFTKYFIINFQ